MTVTTVLVESLGERASRLNHKAWSLPFDAVDPTAADDLFVYLKNNGDKDVILEQVDAISTVAGILELFRVTGTAVGVTDGTPVNKTNHAGDKPDVTYGYGVDITGLTDAGKYAFIELVAVTARDYKIPHGGVRIRKTEAVALSWTQATGVLSGVLHVYEEP